MLDEINKIGEINSINDLFDFKLSIKTIIMLAIAWSICAGIFVIFMFGGINNTIEYATNVLESTKKSIIINRDKTSTNSTNNSTNNNSANNSANHSKKNDEDD
jgi:flagellar basal body-associated protein FliL